MARDKDDEQIEEASPPPANAGGRTCYISIPIRPLTGNVSDEHLDRLTLYFTLYGAAFPAVGAIAIVLPLIFGLSVQPLISWLLVLSGALTLLQFILICGAPGTTAFLLLGILHLCIGLWLLAVPGAGPTGLTFIFSGWFFGHGIVKILMAYQVSNVITWPGVLVAGLLSIVLTFVIFVLTPKFGFNVIAIAFGGDLIMTGLSLLLISLMAFLGKGHRSVSDADAIREPLVHGGGQAAASA